MKSEIPEKICGQEQIREQQLDAALNSYPVVPLPASFTSQVMAQVALTPQELKPMAVRTSSPGIVRHYLRLYGLEFSVATLLTLLLGLCLIWPLFAQVGLLPTLWSGIPIAIDISVVETRLATYIAPYIASHYILGLISVILLELGVLLLAWIKWIESTKITIE